MTCRIMKHKTVSMCKLNLHICRNQNTSVLDVIVKKNIASINIANLQKCYTTCGCAADISVGVIPTSNNSFIHSGAWSLMQL